MEKLQKVLETYWRENVPDPGRFCYVAACSGGRDSMSLLRLLIGLREKSPIRLLAVYVHHGLRPEADAEARMVRSFCHLHEVPFVCECVDVSGRAAEYGESLEEAARNLRYEALHRAGQKMREETGAEDYRIVLAHHAKDQAETVLLQMLRGSGLRGLCGMAGTEEHLLRPLLEATPAMIEETVTEWKLPFCEDASNRDETYLRNWIRHSLLPLLASRNPSIVSTLGRTARLLREDEAYLEEQTEEAFIRCFSPAERSLEIAQWRKLPKALAGRVLRRFVRETGSLHDVGEVHIAALGGLCQLDEGKKACLPGAMTYVVRSGRIRREEEKGSDGRICCMEEGRVREDAVGPECPDAEISLRADGEFHSTPWGQIRLRSVTIGPGSEILRSTYTKWLRYDILNKSLCLRTRRPGDRIRIGNGHQSIQDYMVNRKIAQEKRDRIPMIFCGRDCLWLIGERLSEDAYIRPGDAKVLEITWIPDPLQEEEPNA